MLFDWLVTGQIVATNPAHAVRGPKHVVKPGKTTVLDADQARKLLHSTDISTAVGLRDRTGTLTKKPMNRIDAWRFSGARPTSAPR